jgi:hypothetical protein
MSGTATMLSTYSYPTGTSWGSPNLEVFALDSDGLTYWKWKNSSTPSLSSWNPQAETLDNLGGVAAPFEQGIAAVTRGVSDVDIFVAGTDFALYHKYHPLDLVWGPSPTNWEYRGGILSTSPTAVSWGHDRLDVFVLGEAPLYQLFQIYWSSATGWSNWINLGGSWETYAPTAMAWGPDRIDVFVVDPNTKSLHHKYWDGNLWQPLNSSEDLGGYCTSRPIAVSRASGLIDIFVRGGDAALWHLSYSNGWTQWVSIDPTTPIQAEPEAVSWGFGSNVEVFAWGDDDALLHKSFGMVDGVLAWTPSTRFEIRGEGLTGPPKAVCDDIESVHVFAYLQNGQVGHRVLNHSLGSWSPSEGFDILGIV